MSRPLHTASRVGYFACWITTAALTAFLLATLLWESVAADSSLLRGVDDDFALLALPLGALLGVWAARRTRRARRFQLACLPVGVALVGLGLYQAREAFVRADGLTGTGPFAGLGEYIDGLLFWAVAVIGVLVAGMGACGAIAGSPEKPPG